MLKFPIIFWQNPSIQSIQCFFCPGNFAELVRSDNFALTVYYFDVLGHYFRWLTVIKWPVSFWPKGCIVDKPWYLPVDPSWIQWTSSVPGRIPGSSGKIQNTAPSRPVPVKIEQFKTLQIHHRKNLHVTAHDQTFKVYLNVTNCFIIRLLLIQYLLLTTFYHALFSKK